MKKIKNICKNEILKNRDFVELFWNKDDEIANVLKKDMVNKD